MGQVHLVRHGQASFGAADYDQLSQRGVEQARLLGGWFADCGIRVTRVVSGSLRRHRQTAEACLASLPDTHKPAGPGTVEPGFDEFDHQEMLARHRPELADPVSARALLEREGNPRRALQTALTEAFERWMSGRHDADYREPWPAFRARCRAALDRVIESAGASQTIVVFTSGGPIAAICQDLLGLSNARAAELNTGLVNSAVTRLLYQPGRVSLSTLNGYPHLEKCGEPGHITYR